MIRPERFRVAFCLFGPALANITYPQKDFITQVKRGRTAAGNLAMGVLALDPISVNFESRATGFLRGCKRTSPLSPNRTLA